jgi:hypothetical protein
MGHPPKMKAITAAKNKSDQIDARKIADSGVVATSTENLR